MPTNIGRGTPRISHSCWLHPSAGWSIQHSNHRQRWPRMPLGKQCMRLATRIMGTRPLKPEVTMHTHAQTVSCIKKASARHRRWACQKTVPSWGMHPSEPKGKGDDLPPIGSSSGAISLHQAAQPPTPSIPYNAKGELTII